MSITGEDVLTMKQCHRPKIIPIYTGIKGHPCPEVP